QYLFLRLPPPERVLALHRGHRLNCMGAPNGLRAGLGKAEVLDLSSFDELFHCARDVLDGHLRVDAVLVKQVNGFYSEPLQRLVRHLLDVLGPAVEAQPTWVPVGMELKPKLGGDHHFATKGLESFADEFFICIGAIYLGGIEKRDAPLHRSPDQGDHLFPGTDGRVAEAHPHTAEPERRYLQAALS